MSEQHRTIANDTVNDVSDILKDAFQSLLVSISRLENKNKDLENRVEDLEDLLEIAKGTKNG